MSTWPITGASELHLLRLLLRIKPASNVDVWIFETFQSGSNVWELTLANTSLVTIFVSERVPVADEGVSRLSKMKREVKIPITLKSFRVEVPVP